MRPFYLVLFGLLAFGPFSYGQGELPDEVPERIMAPVDSAGRITDIKYPLKAISVRYGQSFPYEMKSFQHDEDEVFSNNNGEVVRDRELLIKYKLPILLKDKFKMLVGHNYFSQHIIFDDKLKQDYLLNQFNGRTLKNNRFTLYGLYDTRENQRISVVFSTAFNGDYEKFLEIKKRYTIYRAIALYSFVPNEKLEWGFGLYAKYGFRNKYVLPFAIVNYDFNENWGLEFVGTSLRVRNRPNLKNIFYYGVEFSSRDFSIDLDYVDDNGESVTEIFEMRWPKIFFRARWERQILEILWMEVSGGLQTNLTPRIEGPGYTRDIELSINSYAPFLTAGIFITPPKKWLD